MKGKKVFRLNRRFYMVSVIAVLLSVIVIALLSSVSNGNNELSLFYSPVRNGAVVLSDGEDTGNTVPGKSIASVRYNSDSTACAVLMSDGATYSLYAVDNSSVEKVAENCTSNAVCSFYGKNFVYMAADGYLYSGNTRVDESVEQFAVSPDCSVVIYSKKEESGNKLYLYRNGKATYVNDNYIPLAVSDDAGYLYVLSGDDSLYILNEDGTMQSKLCSDVQTDALWFSDDLLSVVFSDGEYTYISTQGRSRVRLIPGKANPVVPDAGEIRLNSEGTAFICNDDDLTDIFYSAQGEGGTNAIFYINDDCIRIDIADSVKKFVVTGDEKMTYLDSMGKIYKYDGESSELAVSGASDFEASSDNRYIYYMTTTHEVYCVKGNKNQLVASGADKMYMTSADKLLLIMTDNNLYKLSGTKRSEVIASDVRFCICEGDITFIATDYNSETGTFSLYSSTDGGKFRFVAENIIKTTG